MKKWLMEKWRSGDLEYVLLTYAIFAVFIGCLLMIAAMVLL